MSQSNLKGIDREAARRDMLTCSPCYSSGNNIYGIESGRTDIIRSRLGLSRGVPSQRLGRVVRVLLVSRHCAVDDDDRLTDSEFEAFNIGACIGVSEGEDGSARDRFPVASGTTSTT